jgi:hypothetical protein
MTGVTRAKSGMGGPAGCFRLNGFMLDSLLDTDFLLPVVLPLVPVPFIPYPASGTNKFGEAEREKEPPWRISLRAEGPAGAEEERAIPGSLFPSV